MLKAVEPLLYKQCPARNKKITDYIVSSNDEGGMAELINKFILLKFNLIMRYFPYKIFLYLEEIWKTNPRKYYLSLFLFILLFYSFSFLDILMLEMNQKYFVVTDDMIQAKIILY